MKEHHLVAALCLGMIAGCGGGDDSGNAVLVQTAPAPGQTIRASITYPKSVVLGNLAAQPLDRREAAPPAATVVVTFNSLTEHAA